MLKLGLCSSWGCAQAGAVLKLGLCSSWGCALAGAVLKLGLCSSWGCAQAAADHENCAISAESFFVVGNRSLADVGKPSALAFTTVPARGLAECAQLCGSACQAVVLSRQAGRCHLLEFALAPTGLNGTLDGEFFERG